MQEFWNIFRDAFWLVISGDRDLWEVVALSLKVSLAAILLSSVVALPIGAALAVLRFRGRKLVIVLINALMGLPPVFVGLLVYLALSRSGPLGALELLYTPTAMIIAQALLVTPIIVALTRQLLENLESEYSEQLRSFGMSRLEAIPTLLWDGRVGLVTAILAGFGRAIAEVGAVLIVGGNINHVTRVMTTTIALETSRGNLELALSLGLVLIFIAVCVNAAVSAIGNWSEGKANG